VFHHPKGGYKDEAAFVEADEAFRRKWLAGRQATARAPIRPRPDPPQANPCA
jgi:hypothetical protein